MRIPDEIDHNIQRETVLVCDASDIGIAPGAFPLTLEVGRSNTEFKMVGYVYSADRSSIALVIYIDGNGNMLRVYND